MKKFLAGSVITLVLSATIVGALSVVPHAHGEDFDHSKHQTCPIYQLGLHDSSADLAASFAFDFTLLAAFTVVAFRSFAVSTQQFFHSLRAPPII